MPEERAPDPMSCMREARDGLRQRVEALAGSVDELATNAGFVGLLVGASKLWRYGPFNQYLIHSERPDATAVAGRRQWERLGRVVREGEAPIWILAPRKSRSGGYPFIVVDVFDITQTEGPPPPPTSIFKEPRGECALLPAIEEATQLLDIRHEYVDEFSTPFGDDTETLGKAFRDRRIAIRASLSPMERARVIIHECAHVLLLGPYGWSSHGGGRSESPPSHVICEAEAEATTFVVLEALGLPSIAPSYIAWVGGRGRTIMASMRRIIAASRTMLFAVEGRRPTITMPRLQKEPAPRRQRLFAKRRYVK